MTTSATTGLTGTGAGRAIELEAMAGLLDGGVREAGRRGYAEALRIVEEQLARVAAMSAAIQAGDEVVTDRDPAAPVEDVSYHRVGAPGRAGTSGWHGSRLDAWRRWARGGTVLRVAR